MTNWYAWILVIEVFIILLLILIFLILSGVIRLNYYDRPPVILVYEKVGGKVIKWREAKNGPK